MEICKQQSEIEKRHLYLNIWFCGRQTDLSVMGVISVHIYGFLKFVGVKVGVANFFWVNRYVLIKTINLS